MNPWLELFAKVVVEWWSGGRLETQGEAADRLFDILEANLTKGTPFLGHGGFPVDREVGMEAADSLLADWQQEGEPPPGKVWLELRDRITERVRRERNLTQILQRLAADAAVGAVHGHVPLASPAPDSFRLYATQQKLKRVVEGASERERQLLAAWAEAVLAGEKAVYRAIGRRLGISEGTARVRAHRLRKKLLAQAGASPFE